MHKIIVTLIICYFQLSYSQKKNINILPLENDKVVYTEVVIAENLSKTKIYNAAKKWITHNYKSTKDLIEIDSKKTGEIIINGSFNLVYNTRAPKIKQTITILIKNNKYKYTIDNFVYSDKQGDIFLIERFPKNWGGKKKVYQKIDTKIKSLIKSLKEEVSASSSKSDW